jgi:hypothetical protein
MTSQFEISSILNSFLHVHLVLLYPKRAHFRPMLPNQGRTSCMSKKLRCETCFQPAFTACSCVFNVFTLVWANQGNFFDNATACSKCTLKMGVAMQLNTLESRLRMHNIRPTGLIWHVEAFNLAREALNFVYFACFFDENTLWTCYNQWPLDRSKNILGSSWDLRCLSLLETKVLLIRMFNSQWPKRSLKIV